MKRAVLIAALAVAILAMALLLWCGAKPPPGGATGVEARPVGSEATRPPALGSPAATTSRPAAWSSEEIFRRAFWQHPGPGDVILHAERREEVDADRADAPVLTWQWFLAVRPSPALLARLRDPEVFGLARGTRPRRRDAPAALPPPAWFPNVAGEHEFEILETASSPLVVYYRARDNLLFATDTGAGFASAAHPLNDT